MSDNEIIASIRDGDHAVTTRTYQKYRREFIMWLMKKYHCPEEDAKEVYQLSFLTFYTQISSAKLTHITSSIKTYLFGIGKNKYYQHQRTENRFVHDTMEHKHNWASEDDSMNDEQENRYQRLDEALDKLGEPCRQILVMVYYEKRAMEYITDKLGYKNSDTTKNQKYKCMCRLKKLLATTLKIDEHS